MFSRAATKLIKKFLNIETSHSKKTHEISNKPIEKKTQNPKRMIRREIFIAIAGKNHIKGNGVQLVSGLDIINVGSISYFEPPIISQEGSDSAEYKGAFKAIFTYFADYNGPSLDPVNLNYENGQRSFALPNALRKEGMFRVFSDCLPSGSGLVRLNKEFPETKNLSELKLLKWLADGGGRKEKHSSIGFASGALLFFTKYPGDEHPLDSLEEVGEFRAKCVADLAGLVVKMTDKELTASWVHGGAQIKTTYWDESGEIGPTGMHYIVKFNDLTKPNNARIEHGSLELAKVAGIRAAKSIVVRVTSNGVFVADLFLIERYDRYTDVTGSDRRRHRLSLMSLMDPSKIVRQDGGDYQNIFDAIRRVSANPQADLVEMFRRLLFNIALNNTDDHLKNHEFLYDPETGDWRLSPAYDINPNSYAYPHATSIAGYTNGILSEAFVTLMAEKFGIELDKALSMRLKVLSAMKSWKQVFENSGCTEEDLAYVEKAINQHGRLAEQKYGFHFESKIQNSGDRKANQMSI